MNVAEVSGGREDRDIAENLCSALYEDFLAEGGNSYLGAWYTFACQGYGSVCDILPGRVMGRFVKLAHVMGLHYRNSP